MIVEFLWSIYNLSVEMNQCCDTTLDVGLVQVDEEIFNAMQKLKVHPLRQS